VTAVVDGVGPDGSKTHWEYTANFDGKPYPVTGNGLGDMVVTRRVNPTTIESSYTLKGKATVVNTRTVSADGMTLTSHRSVRTLRGRKSTTCRCSRRDSR
jgi:hypothetical protein